MINNVRIESNKSANDLFLFLVIHGNLSKIKMLHFKKDIIYL